jgi:hypothetical protein
MSYFHSRLLVNLTMFWTCFISNGVLAQNAAADLAEAETEIVQRLMQYDYVLDEQMSAKVGMCMDELMGGAWLLPAASTAEIRHSVAERARHAAENCAVAATGEKSRLVAELRAMTERQLKLAARLERPVADARLCVAKSPSTLQLRQCVTTAMGRPPLETDWVNWLRLYERRPAQ